MSNSTANEILFLPATAGIRHILDRLHEARQFSIDFGIDGPDEDERKVQQRKFGKKYLNCIMQSRRFQHKHIEQEIWSSINELYIIRRRMRDGDAPVSPPHSECIRLYNELAVTVKDRHEQRKTTSDKPSTALSRFWYADELSEEINDMLHDVVLRLEKAWRYAQGRKSERILWCDNALVKSISELFRLHCTVQSHRRLLELIELEDNIDTTGGTSVGPRL
jgi:uncharacterized LabA/DUF88 family protein